MFRHLLLAVALTNVLLTAPASNAQTKTAVKEYTRADFINVEGATLNDKLTRAVAQCRAAKLSESCWLAWHFPVRENTRAGEFHGFYYRDDDGIKLERREDPKLTAVFLLADISGAQTNYKRVKTLNLGEPYVFENHPVYWLGDIEVSQSIAQLDTLQREVNADAARTRSALRAIGSHDSPRALNLLKEVASKTTNEELRRTALSSLGNLKLAEADAALIELFEQSADETFKDEVIRRLGYSETRQALDKLQSIAQRDASARLRKAAVRQLSRTASTNYEGDWNISREEE
jgi:HEAT repeats